MILLERWLEREEALLLVLNNIGLLSRCDLRSKLRLYSQTFDKELLNNTIVADTMSFRHEDIIFVRVLFFNFFTTWSPTGQEQPHTQ